MIIFYEDIICVRAQFMQKRQANKLIECYECLLSLENQSISMQFPYTSAYNIEIAIMAQGYDASVTFISFPIHRSYIAAQI